MHSSERIMVCIVGPILLATLSFMAICVQNMAADSAAQYNASNPHRCIEVTHTSYVCSYEPRSTAQE